MVKIIGLAKYFINKGNNKKVECYRVTIPKPIIQALSWENVDLLNLLVRNNKVILYPTTDLRTKDLDGRIIENKQRNKKSREINLTKS